MNDLISRKALCDYALNQKDKSVTPNDIMRFPSAQPEIIRCKDCKWWDKTEDSPFGYCMAMKHGYMSTNWEIGIYRRYKGDFYCADAEPEGEQE